MHSWSSTYWTSFRTTPCPPLLLPISNPIPPVLQHPSHLTLHHRGLPQFQFIRTGTLQVTLPQPFHIIFLQTSHLISLSHIHPMITLNIKVLIPPALNSHPQVCHLSHPHNSYLIRPALILHHLQVCFCLKIRV